MKVKSNSTMGFDVYLELTESEARALKAITAYGTKNFLSVFYGQLGRSVLEDNEQGLVDLFESIDREIPKHLNRINEARKVFKDLNPNKQQ